MGFQFVEIEGESFSNIPRGVNRVAHLLAKEGFCCKWDVWWIEEAPMVIQEMAEVEKQYLHHLR
ncbi:hypothetical protein EPI10_021410 [Gossypium australe]|uniref:Uncharacterized protein n=1 Tax=Gossypium australe TaxID=47621 RepID=A0A5B6WH61_9ROSI|nr:hypothetical protein EPI10_021410 [Gossypium australe]